MENPDWDSQRKPHTIDFSEARFLCFDLYNLVSVGHALAGAALSGQEERDGWPSDFPLLYALHHDLAEPELSKKLLRLAVLIRTFDDLRTSSRHADEYRAYKATAEKDLLGIDYFDYKQGVPFTIRKACNRIIHAEDFRPVYHNEGLPHDEPVHWGMTGELTLHGSLQEKEWKVSLHIPSFLECVLRLIQFDLLFGKLK